MVTVDVLPVEIVEIMNKIRQAGQEAYLVGGCVRDRYMGIPPHDYDLTTSALPEELIEIFAHRRLILNGMKHGTVGVITSNGPVEVTTYRQDGVYSDHRHPDGVSFTRSLREDLARRDFTMNAMAFDENGRWVDPFGGREDINNRLIRCVGEATRRFEEDALRILRGLRFAARLGFALERETALAMSKNCSLLKEIAAERIFQEFCGILEGKFAADVLRTHGEILRAVLPELDLSEKNLSLLKTLPPDPALRLAALLPEDADDTLRFLKTPNRFRKTVELLLRERNVHCPEDRISVRRRCVELGADAFRTLCVYRQEGKLLSLTEDLLREGVCLSLKDLAVDGKDLMEIGYEGPAIKEQLEKLLDAVTEERLPNERETLLREIKK